MPRQTFSGSISLGLARNSVSAMRGGRRQGAEAHGEAGGLRQEGGGGNDEHDRSKEQVGAAGLGGRRRKGRKAKRPRTMMAITVITAWSSASMIPTKTLSAPPLRPSEPMNNRMATKARSCSSRIEKAPADLGAEALVGRQELDHDGGRGEGERQPDYRGIGRLHSQEVGGETRSPADRTSCAEPSRKTRRRKV